MNTQAQPAIEANLEQSVNEEAARLAQHIAAETAQVFAPVLGEEGVTISMQDVAQAVASWAARETEAEIAYNEVRNKNKADDKQNEVADYLVSCAVACNNDPKAFTERMKAVNTYAKANDIYDKQPDSLATMKSAFKRAMTKGVNIGGTHTIDTYNKKSKEYEPKEFDCTKYNQIKLATQALCALDNADKKQEAEENGMSGELKAHESASAEDQAFVDHINALTKAYHALAEGAKMEVLAELSKLTTHAEKLGE